MKKLIVSLMLLFSVSAFAQHHHHHGHWRHNHGSNPWVWVAPTIIGGVIGYEIARNQQPPVVQAPPPYVIQQVTPQVCSPWTQIINPDGTTTYTRTCNQ